MADNDHIHPDAPAGGGGPGGFRSPAPAGTTPGIDKGRVPGPLAGAAPPVKLVISGKIVAGGDLSRNTILAVNKAAEKIHSPFRHFIAYSTVVKVGGSLSWRANNPGNLRDAPTKIGSVPGAVGHFAVFGTLDDGRAAQRDLYVSKYGDMKVRDAVTKLTPPDENDTTQYLADLEAGGVDLAKDVKSQIDLLMKCVEANEGLIKGIEVERVP
jgi:hypothetical protein